jgi:hypothetical protein
MNGQRPYRTMIVHRRERLQTAAKKAWIDQSIPDPAHIHNICRIDLMAQMWMWVLSN